MKFFISWKERKSCDFTEYWFGKVWSISLQRKNTPLTAQRLLPPHLSAQHHPCAGHLSKKLCLGLGLKKPQSPELQGHCNYRSQGKTALPQHCSLHIFLLGTTHVFGTSAKGCSVLTSPFHVFSHLFCLTCATCFNDPKSWDNVYVWDTPACGFWMFLWCSYLQKLQQGLWLLRIVECERLEVILALAKKSTLQFKLSQESPFASPYATSVFTWKAPDLKISERRMSVWDYIVTLMLKIYPGWFWAFLKMPGIYHLKCLFTLLQVGISPVVDHWAEYPGAWVEA